MSTELRDMQFEILPEINAEAGVVFGIGADVSVNEDGFHPGDDEWTTQDVPNPRRGGTAFGRDTLNGPIWGWDLHLNRDRLSTALESLAEFKTAWRALHIRRTPGKIIPIRYRLNDRYRRVFGRPRAASFAPDNRLLSGYGDMVVDFQCVDGFTYDDVEQVVQVGLRAESQGGMTFPLTFPFTGLPPGLGEDAIVVGGDAPTYPVIRFTGPIITPTLSTDRWSLTLNTALYAGEWIDVDLRPWALTVLKNGSISVAGSMNRRQYLSDMTLEPGPISFEFRGAIPSPQATCTVRWANAHNSI